MPSAKWGSKSTHASDSDGDDPSESTPRPKKKKSSLPFGGGSSGKPPKIRGFLPKKKNLSYDNPYSDDDETGREDNDGGAGKKLLRFAARKRSSSADDVGSIASNNTSNNGSKQGGIFRRNKAVSRGTARNVSFGVVDSEASDVDESSIREKKAPLPSRSTSGIGKMFRNVSFSRDSEDEQNDGRPPRGSSGSRRGRASSDDSTGNLERTKSGDSSINAGDDSDFGYDSAGNPKPRQPGNVIRPSRERARYSVYHGQGTRAVKRKFRVRPYRAFPEPVNWTEEEIYADSLQPSKNAIPVKSYLVATDRRIKYMDIPDQIRTRWGTPSEDGRIGSLRVEVLGCVSLNRSKPDVVAYFVCGDAAFCTDVIQGYRSPMWPSACRRAAIFPIHHAFAKLYVGVFDVRKRTNKDNDAFCGRVVLDLANIRPDTEYDTTIPMRASSFVYDKRKRGVIRLRFSLHWFNERSAVMSYLKGVQTIDDKNPLISGQPTIPCANPRTFRNVAYTVHGQDLPGKYSRVAFRATIRELNLYQVNLQQILIVCVLDVMFYENKLVSFYMFFSAMYSVYFSSVAMVPAICIGYILIQYLNNYRHYIHKKDFNFGYKPLTISELAKSLIRRGCKNHCTNPKSICMHPIEVDKWTKKRGMDKKFKNIENGDDTDKKLDDGKTIRPLDHREFPFSQRDAYPNFCVEDGLAPGTTKGGAGRLHGRLSVYYSTEPDAGEGAGDGDKEEESDLDSDRDDETVMTESQMIGDDGFDMESASDEDDEAHLVGADYNYKRAAMAQKQKTRLVQRVKLGPPQDSDVKGKKVPPQVTLKKMENLMYKFSKNVSVEFVHSGPQDSNDADISMDTGMTQPSKELKAKMALKAKKAQADEYDKILGLTVSYTNPIQRIMSSFMGPVMRMMRVAIFIMRIMYNLSAWRDPFLSFWLLIMLVTLFLILLVFPWRAFFFLTSIAAIGPQNLFLRKILERKAREREKKKQEQGDDSDSSLSGKDGMDNSNNSKSGKKSKSFLSKALGKKDKGACKERTGLLKELYEDLDPSSRIPFSTTGGTATASDSWISSSKKTPTRSVAVPYYRVKKDRFYDWPPDPTVSRATPVPIFEALNDDDSFTQSIPDVPIEELENEVPSGLRQRKPGSKDPNSGEFVPPPDIVF